MGLAPSTAFAQKPEITAETASQFYDARSPTGQYVVSRRRLTTTLGVHVYDLYDTPGNPTGPNVTFRARMRYDADYGGLSAEADKTSRYFIPGFDRGPIDLMYGYVEGRRFLKGWLGFKLGRQYVVDALGWWSFDGLALKITSPYYLACEVYGGLEQRGGMPLSTPRFEREGIWRGDRTGYDPAPYSSFQPNDVAPAYGIALESAGVSWLHGRLTYRRVYNTGPSNVSPFAGGTRPPASYDETRISQERLGYGVDATWPEVGGVKGGFAYDLYSARFGSIYASVDAFATRKLTLSADYDYYAPTFDADSIWNFFLAMPMNDFGVRASLDATDHLALSAGGRTRVFSSQTAADTVLQQPTSPNGLASRNEYPSSATNMMGGGNLAARWHFGEGAVGARGTADFSATGERLGMDLYAERTIETRYVVSGRSGLWQWNDRLRADREATSFQYVASVGYKLWPRSVVTTDFEHSMNQIAGQRFRVMLWLSLAVSR